MRLWTLAVFFVAAVSYCEVEARSVDELKAWADRAEAPFTTVALERMDDSELWGAKRAGRSLDVVIINRSGISFKLTKSACRRGSPSSGLLAESNLDGQTSNVLGFQSADDDSYAYIYCNLSYGDLGEDEYAFNIDFLPENVRGDVIRAAISYSRIYSPQSKDIFEVRIVEASLDTDNSNNQLVFQVVSKNNGNNSPFMQRRGAPVE